MVRAMNYGRLGNVYWQVSVAIAYALEHGLEFTVQDHTTSEYWNPLYLQHLVNKNWNPSLETVVISEPHFHYAPIPWDESYRGKNIVLNGYWQSFLYVRDHLKEIVELFNHPWECRPMVSLHARFGDYRTIIGKHILVDAQYIQSAISLIKEKTGIDRVKVFSDEISYFRDNFGSLYDFEYSTNTDIVKDLEEISCCAHNINSSSTFSLWAALLNRNPDKVVVTQRQWFQPGWDGADTSTILPPEWIKL